MVYLTCRKLHQDVVNPLLKHVFTKVIEWGVVEERPMTGGKFKMFPESKSQLHIPTFEEVEETLKLANPTFKGLD